MSKKKNKKKRRKQMFGFYSSNSNNNNHQVRRKEETEWNIDVDLKSPTIVIPYDLDRLVRSLDNSIDEEFIILLEVDKFKIKDWYVPEQRVTSASAEILETIDPKWNGTIHKHPRGVSNFSATDEKYILSQYDLNILYVNGRYEKCLYNIVKDNYLFRVELDVEVETDLIDVTEELSKIKRYALGYTLLGSVSNYNYRMYDDLDF